MLNAYQVSTMAIIGFHGQDEWEFAATNYGELYITPLKPVKMKGQRSSDTDKSSIN